MGVGSFRGDILQIKVGLSGLAARALTSQVNLRELFAFFSVEVGPHSVALAGSLCTPR